MSQSDYTIADQDGASFLVDINAQLAAIVSNNSGATEPATTYAYQWWADTSSGLLKQRNAANNAWITIGTLASTNLGLLALTGGTLTGAINEAQGADIASAGTVNLTTATGNYVHITGTTTITAITLAQGAERTVVFDGALTLTNGASLLLPTAANITTVAGDTAVFRGEAASVVRCVAYVRKDGTPIKSGGLGTSTNDNAAAGYVGEYIESVIAAGSAVSLTTNTPANITSISLTAGDWDVSASVSHTPAPTTSVTQIRSSISLTSATMDSTVGRAFGIISAANVPATSLYSISSTTLRFSLASTTTIYLVTNDVFTVSTMTAYGILSARRVR
jgi:hypothetical protein